jgi:hypothetical protein
VNADRTGPRDQQRREPLHPPVDGDVVDLNTALDQQLLHVAARQAVTQIPPHRHHDHFGRKPEPDERGFRRQPAARTVR